MLSYHPPLHSKHLDDDVDDDGNENVNDVNGDGFEVGHIIENEALYVNLAFFMRDRHIRLSKYAEYNYVKNLDYIPKD